MSNCLTQAKVLRSRRRHMDPKLHPQEETTERVALLDVFLQDLSNRPTRRLCFPSPLSPAAVPPNDSAAREDGSGDLRAVTSGAISTNGGSPEDGPGGDTGVQEEVLRVLDFLFHADKPLVDSCVQVLDKSRVVRVRARESRRGVWLVQGSRGAPYLCLGNYCSCRSFHELVRRGGSHSVLCKHLLAVRLAPALGVSHLEEVDDNKLAQRISACDYG